MGCRTGFYLLTLRLSYDEVLALLKMLALLKKCIPLAIALEEIPGSKREECGNHLEHNLEDAKRELKNYLDILENL